MAIAASALASIDRVRMDASAQQQQQLQRDSDAALPPLPHQAQSASGLHQHPASLEGRTLEQVSTLAPPPSPPWPLRLKLRCFCCAHTVP